ncbi:MAG: hypothetical protein K9L32_00640 [Chromatiaceae bacterium]|nr:hypothetical protein [Chromatiaceae bacterium]MCF8002712.1 hypothetical protein [Chromatiaceae bacterium]
MPKYDFLPKDINRKRRILGRILNRKELPNFVYRVDTRAPGTIRQQGFQPMDPQGVVTAIDHVKNSLSPNHPDYVLDNMGKGPAAKDYTQWVSTAGYGFFQPIDATFSSHLLRDNSYIYKIDTTIAVQTGPFVDANAHFDNSGLERPYATQREWIKLGGIHQAAIIYYITGRTMGDAMNANNIAPPTSALPWIQF